jgi:hypothetical protein
MDRTACTEPQCLYKGALYLYLLYVICALVYNNFYTNLMCFLIQISLESLAETEFNKNFLGKQQRQDVKVYRYFGKYLCPYLEGVLLV